MASLRKLPKSPFWIGCFTLPDGVRTNRSTKTTDKTLAKRIVADWQDQANNARKGRFVQDQVLRVFNDIAAKIGENGLNTDSVEDFLTNWLSGKGNESTAERYGHTVALFLSSLGKKAKGRLSAITHKEILHFIESRQKEGMASKTLSVDAKTLNTAFNLARRLGFIASNPVEKALALKPIKVKSSQKEHFTPEQVELLIKATSGDWKTAILIGYFTGARLGDCVNMRWDNIDLTNGLIDYQQQKTSKRVVVPIHPTLEKHLNALASTDKPEVCLCPSLAGKGTGGKSGLSEAFKGIMKKAVIDAQVIEGQGNRTFSRLSYHSLRHSFNTTLANQGVDQETRMTLTGHTTVAVNKDYTHLGLPKLRNAISKLPHVDLGS
jgi:integrase